MLKNLLQAVGLGPREARSTPVAAPDYESGTVKVSGLTSPVSLGGHAVTRASSEAVTAYWRGINFLADALASLPVSVLRREDGGGRVELPEHPVARFLDEPTRALTSYEWTQWAQEQVGYEGNAYFYLARDGRGRVRESIPLKAGLCEPFVALDGQLYYRIYDQTAGVPAVPARDILHFSGPGIDPATRKGKSPIAVHREALGEAITLSQLGQAYYANGGGVVGAIKHPGSLTDAQAASLRESFRKAYGGAAKAGSMVMLEGGMEVQSLTSSARDAMYIEARNFSVLDVSRILGVPAHKLGYLDKATFSNIEHQSQELVTDTLAPLVRRREQELERKLFTNAERGRLQIRYNLDARLRGDSKARADFYKTLFHVGAYSPDDIRALEDRGPREGGDRYYVPVNMRAHDEPLDTQAEVPAGVGGDLNDTPDA